MPHLSTFNYKDMAKLKAKVSAKKIVRPKLSSNGGGFFQRRGALGVQILKKRAQK